MLNGYLSMVAIKWTELGATLSCQRMSMNNVVAHFGFLSYAIGYSLTNR